MPNALQITDRNADNPLAQAPSWADAAQSVGGTVSSGVDALGQWLAAQRAKSAQMGLWNDQTGLPTGKGLVSAAQQYGNALMMGTAAPGPKTVEVGGRTLPLNPDGSVTLFHATKDADAAGRIVAEKTLRSAAEPSVYLSTAPSGTGYGDHVVSVNVNPAHLNLDDEFPDGRADFRIDRKSYPVNAAKLLPSSGADQ